MAKQRSTQAQAAAAIRKELKAAFPYTKFSVTSEGFAGGDAVRINWTDGPTSRDVMAITGKYEYGSFDGMIDLYEYTNVRNDIPQVKYVQERRNTSLEAFTEMTDMLNTFWGRSLVVSPDGPWIMRESDKPLNGGGWESHDVGRKLQGMSLVCPACKRGTHVADCFCEACGADLHRKEEMGYS